MSVDFKILSLGYSSNQIHILQIEKAMRALETPLFFTDDRRKSYTSQAVLRQSHLYLPSSSNAPFCCIMVQKYVATSHSTFLINPLPDSITEL